ncbi:MAG: phosphotransferase domain-containing protein [Candidatus Saganbacteria bacterium]|uniref:Phosphotransferase domain-containing protein n=1 Tax=Candidatus Saganbacteria bacterium TaxID=2575572 RepID=A0A833KZP1_UNCSA|nr:MAG: phosphotransferase domain-containing protein [Candidatus Saganbacteria bacterium]
MNRYDFHTHSIFSDGALLPAALIREAEIRDHAALAITDHIDASNIKEVLTALTTFEKDMKGKLPLKFFPGVEISYIRPEYIAEYCKKSRKLGAKVVLVHGESPVEPVYAGTDHAAVSQKGFVDILAHPGNNLTEEDALLAAKNGVFLEISARRGHKEGNKHVAELARKCGAKLLVNTDCHTENDLLTYEQAFEVAKAAGLSDLEAKIALTDNPLELIKRIESR